MLDGNGQLMVNSRLRVLKIISIKSFEPILPKLVKKTIWKNVAPPRAQLTIWLPCLGKLKTCDILLLGWMTKVSRLVGWMVNSVMNVMRLVRYFLHMLHHYAPSLCPININVVFNTMTLNPQDSNWYMDTDATNHMTSSSGTLSPYISMSSKNNIIIGSGDRIPIHGHGHTSFSPPKPSSHSQKCPLCPKLIKNLISVRRFTVDNNVSIEFDPFGFSVKDLWTWMPLIRCNSKGDLYPLSSSSASPTSS